MNYFIKFTKNNFNYFTIYSHFSKNPLAQYYTKRVIVLRHCCVCFVFFVILCFNENSTVSASLAADHLIPMSAVNFNTPAKQTTSAKLSHKEYFSEISLLERQCTHNYQKLLGCLGNEEKTLLSASQSKWHFFIVSLQDTLKPQLNTSVKVFYGIKNKERVTNIYRDAILNSYKQRISDLRRWTKGNFGNLKVINLEDAMRKEELQFKDRAARNIYLMEERYRREEFASQKAWHVFKDAQISFIVKMTNNSNEIDTENLLMLQRINNIRMLQSEGLIFFKQEREE